MVLDDRLRVVAATASAHELVGSPIEVGTAAPALLCGTGPVRPVADAMAAGKPVAASVVRPSKGGEERLIHVRATPLEEGDERMGWLLLMDEEGWHAEGADAPVEPWGILTRNAAMKRLLRDIERAAASDAAVLVRGETGSGKELVARAIHQASTRSGGPFRAINCAALPESLLESALFGHVRGAFTGATSDEPGHFRLADGGTLFLDEIGELPLALQATLLRVLQDKTVIPVGGRDPIPVDVRIVTATHRALRQEVQEGRFRADLMFRVRVLPLFLPPLRERPEDIELLAWRFVEQRNERGGRHISRITQGAREAMSRYDWPGNVRELDNAIEYAFVMGEGAMLAETDLPPEVQGDRGGRGGGITGAVNAPEPLPDEVPPEARRLLRAIERAGGHHGRAAASLGISRTTLWRRLRKHGLG
ncbi:MAG TPA: AAA family ATPase [Polyangiaceae bacterium]|nr:AAA family ATPase [Polyangiaceae bacterium]